jgi:hypothetical protein
MPVDEGRLLQRIPPGLTLMRQPDTIPCLGVSRDPASLNHRGGSDPKVLVQSSASNHPRCIQTIQAGELKHYRLS